MSLSEIADDEEKRSALIPQEREETYEEWCRGKGAGLVRCSRFTEPDLLFLFWASGALSANLRLVLLVIVAPKASTTFLVCIFSFVWVTGFLPVGCLWSLRYDHDVRALLRLERADTPPIEWERPSLPWPLFVLWCCFGAMCECILLNLLVATDPKWAHAVDDGTDRNDEGAGRALSGYSFFVHAFGLVAICATAALPRLAFRFRGVRARFGVE